MTPIYYLHRKTGGIYRVRREEYHRSQRDPGEQIIPMYGHLDDFARFYTVTDPLQAGDRVTFYENAFTGERWARPYEMFHDGRFAMFDGVPDLPGLIPLP